MRGGEELREAALDALGHARFDICFDAGLPRATRERLLPLLAAADGPLRGRVLDILADWPGVGIPEDRLAPLTDLCSDPDMETRAKALAALELCAAADCPNAIDVVRRACRDPDATVRQAALEALATLAPDAARPIALEAAVGRATHAAYSLGRIFTPEVGRALADRLPLVSPGDRRAIVDDLLGGYGAARWDWWPPGSQVAPPSGETVAAFRALTCAALGWDRFPRGRALASALRAGDLDLALLCSIASTDGRDEEAVAAVASYAGGPWVGSYRAEACLALVRMDARSRTALDAVRSAAACDDDSAAAAGRWALDRLSGTR